MDNQMDLQQVDTQNEKELPLKQSSVPKNASEKKSTKKFKAAKVKSKESSAIIDVDAWDAEDISTKGVNKRQKNLQGDVSAPNSSDCFIDVDSFDDNKSTLESKVRSKSFSQKKNLTKHLISHSKTSKSISPSNTHKRPKTEHPQSQNSAPQPIISTPSVQITKVAKNIKANSLQKLNKKAFHYVDVDASDLDSKFKKIVVKSQKTPSISTNKSKTLNTIGANPNQVRNLKRRVESNPGNNTKRSKLSPLGGSVNEKERIAEKMILVMKQWSSHKVFNVDSLYALASAKIASVNNDSVDYGINNKFISNVQTLDLEVTNETDNNLSFNQGQYISV